MARQPISTDNFCIHAHSIWGRQWFALTSGSWKEQAFNSMTVAWGSFGVMWAKPFVQVVVRPTRYTHEFMSEYETFTLCAFDEAYRHALQILGTRSGRDGDKIKASGLTPIPSTKVEAPAFDEAGLIIECHKIYTQDFDPSRFIDPDIEANYPAQDYHRVYFGEIVAITGDPCYAEP
jgi:flavin reductase (DIM6/NTAB) family NADH-FMN oxidoreductase RutF